MLNIFVRSISGKLRLFGLAAIVPLLALGGILLYRSWVEMPRMVSESTLEIAEEVSHQIDGFIEQTGKVLLALSREQGVRDLAVDDVNARFKDLKQVYPEYENFSLADTGGQIIASAEQASVGINVGDRGAFQEALAEKRLAVGEIVTSRRTGLPAIFAYYPVIGQEGRPVGVLGATIGLSNLQTLLSRLQLRQEYRATVFDRDGQLVFEAGPAGATGFSTQCASCHAAPSPHGELAPRVWVGDGWFHALSETNKGWHVLISAPSSIVLGTAYTQAWITLGLVAAIFIVAMGLSNVIGRGIEKPILRLTQAARRFGKGEEVLPLAVTTRDEVGALTESFNAMVEEIRMGQRHLEERQARLAALNALDRAVASNLSLPAVLGAFADEIHGLAGVDGAVIYLPDESGNLTLVASRGQTAAGLGRNGRQTCDDEARRAFESEKPPVSEVCHEPCQGLVAGSKGVCLPVVMSSKGRRLGAILFCTSRANGFTEDERGFLSTVAMQASTAVDNARLYGQEQHRVVELEALTESLRSHAESLEKAHEGIVETLNLSLQAKDPYTKGHADRVGLLSRRIAGRLGFTRERQNILARAARLHDIGKISIPEHLLAKEGPLTPPERTQFQLHPERSAELLRYLTDLDQVLPAIRGHHERLDGKGYPDGLMGEEIPLEARIIAVADAYDAMTTDRPYRPAMDHREVLKILETNAGIQWDPQVIQALLDTFQEEERLDRI
ncbi:MAG: HD domain-containing protein [Dehalococcoidia bacterium]|nr:HD domain-containing protein [Dehalococcoidia bacterium]